MLISTPLIFNSCFSAILLFLLISILSPQKSPYTLSHATAIKLACLTSIPPSIIILANHTIINNTQFTWLSLNTFSLSLDFRYDIYSIVFTSIALFITYNIVVFSSYYMAHDSKINTFTQQLTIFLLAMIILVSSNNIFQLLIGWEGVGFLSFLLIGWWSTRSDANTAALQAIIYNRFGDIGILLSAGWLLTLSSSWNFDTLFILLNTSNLDSSLFLWGCLLAATGKSAQFGLHPWLPAAMEGPTPVSALLHSSTMVVAGIFLLIRVSPIISLSPSVIQAALLLGSITAFFAASCAITQHDLKKIIAFSTTSQLGLMMVAIGLNLPTAAFFHICTHGFFKAMLFLCSGSIIHNSLDEQDLRKGGGLAFSLPITSACLTLGSMALAGVPFLAGFYSKDLILETAALSPINFIAISLAIIATTLTATYSSRIILASFSSNTTITSLNPISEEQKSLTSPIKNLAFGATLVGWLLTPLLITEAPSPISLPLKTLTLLIAFIGLFIAILTFKKSTSFETLPASLPSSLRNFFTNLWHYAEVTHRLNSFNPLFLSQKLITRLSDQGWGEQIGAQGIGISNTTLAQKTQFLQSGLIKQYIAISLLTLSLVLLLILSTL
ncbi:NADH dehydrogenase subunit 5 (mitochondrion) [Saccoglossus kowalevskii]|uniref:NADH-ubiquinone oxidoreductase chain 5 n=1 Tax=Saccoglossus kowalevskii TaxID=10224 RepID=Q3L8T2_SACKO|nr:NADH dehydrogenase subunit 5 [Saccoglossus kowalevskii]AAQ92986.1 NADH dehydrogenase subunit 5 [Saccoglossus kowalevskii]